MANFEGIRLTQLVVSFGMCAFLVVNCRPTNIQGTVTHTKITHFPDIYTKLVNPCGVVPTPKNNAFGPTTTTSLPINPVNSMDFYHSLASALRHASQMLDTLVSEDPSLPECNGITLDSLPITPLMDNMNEGQAIKQAYKTSLFLSIHFHLISLDRQMNVTGTAIIADQQSVPERSLPISRFQRCGNETERFPVNLQDVTIALESILCTIISSASIEQTESFREPLSMAGNTILYRYHTSCSTLQTRDCLVIKEAIQSLSMISRKYDQLIGQSNGVIDNDHDYDNHI